MRKLHRQPYAHDIKAAKDFEEEEADKEAAQQELEDLAGETETFMVDKVADAVEDHEELVDAVEVIADTGLEIAIAAQPGTPAAPLIPPEKVTNWAEHKYMAMLASLALRALSSTLASMSRRGFARAAFMSLRLLPATTYVLTNAFTAAFYGFTGYGLYRVASRALRAMRDAVTQVAESIAGTVQGAMEDTKQLAQHLRDSMSGRKTPAGGGRDNIRGSINTTYNNEVMSTYDAAMAEGAEMDLYASELLDMSTPARPARTSMGSC